ncbi:MAG: putative ABC transporter permease [Acholeplasma sp.]|nr:putative ABC transporter permease [Acholeplasma sp.]
MKILISYLTLFIIGSFLGWILELFYRRFFSAKKWLNPGFLTGPIVPLYGFGIIILHLISLLQMDWYYQVILITISMTLIEYIAGIIFIHGLKIKLWDYSNMRGNIQGLICPLFTFFWGFIGTLFLFFINPYIIDLLNKLATTEYFHLLVFVIGMTYGVLLIDFLHSLKIANKLKALANKTKETIIYEKFKEFIAKERSKKSFFIPIKLSETTNEWIENFSSSLKKIIFKDDNKK